MAAFCCKISSRLTRYTPIIGLSPLTFWQRPSFSQSFYSKSAGDNILKSSKTSPQEPMSTVAKPKTKDDILIAQSGERQHFKVLVEEAQPSEQGIFSYIL